MGVVVVKAMINSSKLDSPKDGYGRGMGTAQYGSYDWYASAAVPGAGNLVGMPPVREAGVGAEKEAIGQSLCPPACCASLIFGGGSSGASASVQDDDGGFAPAPTSYHHHYGNHQQQSQATEVRLDGGGAGYDIQA